VSFPLVPRGRLVGLSFGTMRSLRRGTGSDVAGARLYQAGDDVHAIDWAASARLSSARQSDEFIVREHYADEAPRVVIVCDRRPEMSFYSAPLPWLDKAEAMRQASELILESASLVGGFVGYLDHGEGHAYWVPPRGVRRLWEVTSERLPSRAFRAPPDTLEQAFAHLTEHKRAAAAGSFVFCLSDFLPMPSEEVWLWAAQESRWDVIPVVIQDPTWEQSFPDVSGVEVPLRDPRSGRSVPIRLTAREAAARRRANEERFERLVETFRELDLEPVLVSSDDRAEILGAFLEWAEVRLARRAA
jgi:uncharacterized protein (DUF58 family)